MEPTSPDLQLMLQRCYLYICLSCNSSLFHFIYFCRSGVDGGTGIMMKQLVLCLNLIDQHYLYFHLPAEGNTVTFTFDTLFIYLFIFNRHYEHK